LLCIYGYDEALILTGFQLMEEGPCECSAVQCIWWGCIGFLYLAPCCKFWWTFGTNSHWLLERARERYWAYMEFA